MTLIHVLLIVLVTGIVILAILLVKKIRDLRIPPEETDDRLSERVREILRESAQEDASGKNEGKADFEE
jgi:hypothetical protein